MTVAPLLLGLPIWFFIAAPTALMALALLLLGPPGLRIVRRWLIRREDRRNGWNPVLTIYDDATDPAAEAGQAFSLRGVDSVRLDHRVYVYENDRKRSAVRFRVRRMLRPGRPRIQVEYRWRDAKQDWKQELVANRVSPVMGISEERYRLLLLDRREGPS